jgi:hypothetical protein
MCTLQWIPTAYAKMQIREQIGFLLHILLLLFQDYQQKINQLNEHQLNKESWAIVL